MIGAHIEFILIVTGALAAVAILQFVAPAPMLRTIYGEVPEDLPRLALARHWGLLIFLIEALLIYAAFHPAVRDPAVLVAAFEKIGLGVGVLGTACAVRRWQPRSLLAIQSSRSSICFISRAIRDCERFSRQGGLRWM